MFSPPAIAAKVTHPLATFARENSSLRSSGNLTASPQVHLSLTRPDAFISPGRQAVREADALDIMGTILFQAVPGLRRGIVL